MSVTETETAVPPCARAWPSLDFSPSFTVGASHVHTMSITEKGFGEAGNSGQCDIMRGTGSDWAPHSRHTGDKWLQWPWEGRESQDPPPRPPHTLEMPGAQAWEQAGVPQEAQVLTRELVSPKVQICEVAKIVAAVPTVRTQ